MHIFICVYLQLNLL